MPADKAQDIVDEIKNKADDYESNMMNFMNSAGEAGEMFRIVRPRSRRNTYSNPRLSEMFRAVNTVGTLKYRMQTSQEPYISVEPADFLSTFEQVQDIQSTLLTQARAANYKKNLLKANIFEVLYGTVIVQEDYTTVNLSPRGRAMPITTFRPRPLDQIFFDRGVFEIEDSTFIGTFDIVTKEKLRALMNLNDKTSKVWSKKGLQAAIDDDPGVNTISPYIMNRLNRAGIARGGMNREEAVRRHKEIIVYYGKFDCLNDGIEYVAAVINRKHLVRFHANNFQHGKRQFRISKWVDFTDPWGEGLYSLFGDDHRSIDANRQKMQDIITFDAYNMWGHVENSVNMDDLRIQPLQIVGMQGRGDLFPLERASNRAVEAAIKLEQMMVQGFRAGTNATDTLQAIPSEGGTATEAALSQNEAMRAISVKAELSSVPLVREHFEIMHANNAQFIKSPININRSGVPRLVYPSDLRVDVDINVKTTTDKDFLPQQIQQLSTALQIITSTKSQHPELGQISIIPVVRHLLNKLGIPMEELQQQPTAPGPLSTGELGGLSAATVPGAVPGDLGNIAETPAGPVQVS
jgi:hypothetical protein